MTIVAAGMATVAVIKKPNQFTKINRKRKTDGGKKVKFVEDENEPANADGVCGHLEEVEIYSYAILL